MVNFYLRSLSTDKSSSFKATWQKRLLILWIWGLFQIWESYVRLSPYAHGSGCGKALFVNFGNQVFYLQTYVLKAKELWIPVWTDVQGG